MVTKGEMTNIAAVLNQDVAIIKKDLSDTRKDVSDLLAVHAAGPGIFTCLFCITSVVSDAYLYVIR